MGGRDGGGGRYSVFTWALPALLIRIMIIFWPITLALFLGALFSTGVQGADSLTTAGYVIAFLVAVPVYACRWYRRHRA